VPGPALSPQDALKKFELPAGFRLELVASEPDIVNPVKMCFDSRGRIWLIESLEYPRLEAGPGRDRVRVLEDTDGDGKADKFEVFAEGLNIPGGIALGYGGVFVTNSPDLLLLKDTDGDGKADEREVLLTGFGRHDTHEVPNTLVWGPDGWLYGLNGVFNPAKIRHQGKEHEFTCALWRYHPRSRDFEVFAEGTSNPWGLGFDAEGAAFVEACVIDHLYHLTETGYYHRQAGAYPPFTWKIESVVRHHNYKAAYCGLDFYDADVYPVEYRDRVYYGNIHGNCVNSDTLRRDGSTYFAGPAPIILKTDDAWFLPVDIRLGPDGCFYVLDWYDRYHCYQDARRDSQGIDRLKGRLWRLAYGDVKAPRGFDLAKERSIDLVTRLSAANRWWRDEARRILSERRDPVVYDALRSLVLDAKAQRRGRMQALWTLAGCDQGAERAAVDRDFHLKVMRLEDGSLRAWGVRIAGNLRVSDLELRSRVQALAADPHADVRLQVAVAARKLFDEGEAFVILLEVLSHSEGDALIPKIVWRNLEPLVEDHGAALVSTLGERGRVREPALEPLLGRIVERLLARRTRDPASVAGMVALLVSDIERHDALAAQCFEVLGKAIAAGGLDEETLATVRPLVAALLKKVAAKGRKDPLYLPAATLAAVLRDPAALDACRQLLRDEAEGVEARSQALRALAGVQDDSVLAFARDVLAPPAAAIAAMPRPLAAELFSALGRLEAREVAEAVLAGFAALPADLRPPALDLLAQRRTWARALLGAVEAKKVDPKQLNVTQVRRLLGLKDEKLSALVTKTWGAVREERSPEREKVIARMRKVLERGEGDSWRGKAVYEKVCAQCHVLFGMGSAVGPDITVNGRETLDLLLSNLLDPNLVIGKDYFAHTVLTADGRALTGLVVEDSPQRVVLKVAGGKEEAVARAQVVSLAASPVSLMPEDLEKTVTEDEFRDLVTFLRYDEAPPEPVELAVVPGSAGEARRLRVEQSYGEVKVSASSEGAPGDGGRGFAELLHYVHSTDARPFIHPLRAPGGGAVLTAVRPEDHPWQYGLFTGLARVNGIDFWHEKGWIRSHGLKSLVEKTDRVEIVSVSDWLTERRGGKKVLSEEQKVTVHAPVNRDRYYFVDFDWTLAPVVDVEIGRHDYGGLAFRPASHVARRHERSADTERRTWQGMSGRFGGGEEGRPWTEAGVVIFDHPENPGFPSAWRVDDQGLINPAITAREPMKLAAGKTVKFRYRLLVHSGPLEREAIEAEYCKWAVP
jgi:putative heme-binding domain-containing protein